MLAKTTISGEECAVLRRAVLADLPTIDAVLAAYQDVNQRHARALHERFQRELSLLNNVQAVEDAEISLSYLVMCRLADAFTVAPAELVAFAHELPDDDGGQQP
jgi:hypothetical protein